MVASVPGLSLQDDGCGFDLAHARSGARLRNITDRIHARGGSSSTTQSYAQPTHREIGKVPHVAGPRLGGPSASRSAPTGRGALRRPSSYGASPLRVFRDCARGCSLTCQPTCTRLRGAIKALSWIG